MNSDDVKRFEQIVFDFNEEIKTEFRHQLGIQTESFQHKMDILVEGHQMLAEKIDRMEARLDQRMDGVEKNILESDAGLSKKIDAVTAELKDHRADTEAHKKIYKVKEE